MEEEWRAIPGADGYEVSSLGRVRSLDRVVIDKRGGERFYVGRLLKPTMVKGYPTVRVGNRGRQSVGIHVLVLLAFIGPRPFGADSRHLDDVKTNNVLSNLAWGSRKDNFEDRRRLGTLPFGKRSNLAKLTRERVAALRRTKSLAERNVLADQFGITRRHARRVAGGMFWSDLVP